MPDQKKVLAPKSLRSTDPTEDLNYANLQARHVRAIADLVAHVRREEIYDSTILVAMDVVMEKVERIEDLLGGVFPHVSAGRRMEVVNG